MTTMPANPTPAEGVVVVPMEPTGPMKSAISKIIRDQCVCSLNGQPPYMDNGIARNAYRAMLAARPAAPTQSAGQMGEVTREWIVKVIQQHAFAQDAADMILAALSQPEQKG